MTYPVYPEYKDSGVEWLGSVPLDWKVVRLRFLCNVTTGDKDNINKDPNGKYPFFVRSKKIERINTYSFDGEAVLTAGDGDIGKIFHYINGRFDFHQRVYKFSSFKEILGGFFYYFIESHLADEVVKLSAKTTVDSLRLPMLQNFTFSFPAMNAQKHIVSFLDCETKKIDRLLEKQQQLIKLLQEKRQVVISDVITKGLNPNTKMKDSGVEWLGEIPEHWEVKSLRFLGLCQNGINIGAEYFGSGYPFVSYGDVYNNQVLPLVGSGLVQSSELDRERYSVKSGDVFFTRTSETIDEIGFSSVCFSDIENATFAGFLIRFRPTTNLISKEFAKHYFGNILLRAFFVKEMNLVTRASLSQDLLKKLPVVIPPITEQLRVGEYLDAKLSTIDILVKKATNAIALIKERRIALISAAITGKIDVRNIAMDNIDNTTTEQSVAVV